MDFYTYFMSGQQQQSQSNTQGCLSDVKLAATWILMCVYPYPLSVYTKLNPHYNIYHVLNKFCSICDVSPNLIKLFP